MKTLYYYIAPRLEGYPLTWEGAKHRASQVNVEEIVCKKFDAAVYTVEHAIANAKRYTKMRLLDIELGIGNFMHNVVAKWFIGRLVICCINGKTNYKYLFEGHP